MNKQRYLVSAFVLLLALGFARIVSAQQSQQDSPQKNEGKASIEGKGKSGDTNFDIHIQEGETQRDQAQSGQDAREGAVGQRGPQGPVGPAGPSGGEVLGMDRSVALFVGLGILAVVIVAIVAASRGREQ